MPFQIIRDDITKVKADVIVNTANPKPVIGSSTDSAIYAAAGEEKLLAELADAGSNNLFQAVPDDFKHNDCRNHKILCFGAKIGKKTSQFLPYCFIRSYGLQKEEERLGEINYPPLELFMGGYVTILKIVYLFQTGLSRILF